MHKRLAKILPHLTTMFTNVDLINFYSNIWKYMELRKVNEPRLQQCNRKIGYVSLKDKRNTRYTRKLVQVATFPKRFVNNGHSGSYITSVF